MSEDTTTATPIFLSTAPDWSKEVLVDLEFSTFVQSSKNGGEQRTRYRSRSKRAITAEFTGRTMREHSLRRSQLVKELSAPVVYPYWVYPFATALVYAPSGNNKRYDLTLGAAKKVHHFRVGGYAFFLESGLTSVFCQIVSITEAGALTVNITTIQPVVTYPVHVAPTIYPCLFGTRADNMDDMRAGMLSQTDELISIQDL